MRVRLARQAEADLREIATWIARDSKPAAGKFSRELRGKCAGLGRSPRRFPVAASVRGHRLRKRLHRDYLIFFIILDDVVEVVRVVHGARDWVSLFDGA